MVEVFKPLTLQEALKIRSSKDTILFAGGSDLMVKYRSWSGTIAELPLDVLFIGHLKELQEISLSNNTLKIGAAVSFSQILEDNRIPAYIKLPLSEIGSPSIRNLGTIGGNICNSSPAGDTLPMLYALDAEVIVASKNNTRTIGISNFIVGAGKNLLKKDEILTSITIPLKDYNRFYSKKVGQRKANAISKLSFFAIAKTNTSEIEEVRIAFGAVAPTVIRSIEIESCFKQLKRGELYYLVDKINGQYANLIEAIDDHRSTKEYRKRVSLQILEKFLLEELIL